MTDIVYPALYEGQEPYIFISYSHVAKLPVYEVLMRLNGMGVRFWYDKGLSKGINWEKNVQQKIKNAAAVWFFFDENFFYSDSLYKEVRFVIEEGKEYCPVYYKGMTFRHFYRQLPVDIKLDEEYETLLTRSFNSKITSIVFNDQTPDAFDAELLEEARKYDALGDATVTFGHQHRKFAFLAKNSIFSRSIFDGISNVFSSVEHRIEKILINPDGMIPIDTKFIDKLKAIAEDDYDGVIIRLMGNVNNAMFGPFKALCEKKRVLLVDVDITPEQKQALGRHCPTYVCSDFLLGGEKVASLLMQTAFSFGIDNTDIVVCCNGVLNKPAYMRSEAIMTNLSKMHLNRTGRIAFNSLTPEDCFNRVKAYFRDNTNPLIEERCLLLYCGNDNVALYLAKRLDIIKTGSLPLSAYKKVVVIGYDGIVGTTGNSILEETPYDYATVDTLPVNQGETAAKLLLREIAGKAGGTVERVPPRIIKSIKSNPPRFNRLKSVYPLLDYADLFILDLDGTIADTETLHWAAYNVLLRQKYGFELKDEDVRKYIGNSEISIYRMIEKDFDIRIDDASFLKERIEAYLDLVQKTNLQPFAWVHDFHRRYANKKIALLTSQVPDVVNHLIQYWGLDDLIPMSRRISAHDGKITKRQVFEHPNRFLDLQSDELGNIVVFEDSNHVAKTASEFGYTVIGIAHQYNKNALTDCTCIIDESVKKGLFVGLSGIDLVFNINQLPSPDQKVKTNQYGISVGGPALKAAITCAQMGGDATLITGIGKSPMADIILKECERYHVRVVDIMPYKALPNMSFVAMHYVNATREIVSGQTTSNEIRMIGDDFYKDFDYCLYDCNLPFFTQELVTNLRAYDIPLVMDCGSWKDNIEIALRDAQYVISSASFRSPADEDVFALQKALSIPCVAMTRGGDAIRYQENDCYGEIEVERHQNAHTLGAGDVFHGAFCYYRFDKGLDTAEALRQASLTATEYVKR